MAKMMKKNIDPASLPKGKGIGSGPKTPGPNFVERGRSKSVWVKDNQGSNPRVAVVRDRGTNPGSSTMIEYDRPAKGKVSIDKMNNRGNFVKSNSMVNTPSVLKRSGLTPSDAVKASSLKSKGTKSAPKKAMASSSSKMASSKKSMMKTSKK
jgi:hypothetical protein